MSRERCYSGSARRAQRSCHCATCGSRARCPLSMILLGMRPCRTHHAADQPYKQHFSDPLAVDSGWSCVAWFAQQTALAACLTLAQLLAVLGTVDGQLSCQTYFLQRTLCATWLAACSPECFLPRPAATPLPEYAPCFPGQPGHWPGPLPVTKPKLVQRWGHGEDAQAGTRKDTARSSQSTRCPRR